MPPAVDLATLWAGGLALVRVVALALTAPIFRAADVPPALRAAIAAGLALVIVPAQVAALSPATAAPASLAEALVSLGGEAMIGASLGLAVALLLCGAELAGRLVAEAAGLSMAEVLDPLQDAPVPVLARFTGLLAMTIFFAAGGHRFLIGGLLESFRHLPPGSAFSAESIATTLVTLTAQGFALGVRAAVSILGALLLANLALGLLARSLPQINLLSAGASVNALLALGGLAIGLGALAWAFQGQIEPALEAALQALQAAAPGGAS